MPCNANINQNPVTFVPGESILFPVGAECVTFTFQLCGNPAAGAPNQVEVEVFWSAAGGAPETQESVLQQTATCGEFQTCFTTYLSPTVSSPDCVAWDLTLPIPAGKNDVSVTVTEIGDPANPGTVTTWVAFK